MLSPQEIESRQFQIGLRGYDVEEVRSFLTRTAEAYRTLLEELEHHRQASGSGTSSNDQPGRGATGGPQSYEAVGREVAAVLTSAREAADRVKEQAQTKVAEIVDAAERKAFELQMEAQVEANERMRELALGSQRIKAAEARLRDGLSQLDALLTMTRFDLNQTPAAPGAAPASSPSPPASPTSSTGQASPWRPVTAPDGQDLANPSSVP
jgi:DivIVA domain-containing protein